MFVYEPPATGPSSPEELPTAGAPAAAQPAGSHASRGSSQQAAAFRGALQLRDGQRFCVVCGSLKLNVDVEAAHVLEVQSASDEQLAVCGLLDVNDVRNGVMLCSTCHGFFDAYLWYCDVDGAIVVADALLHCADDEVRAFWTERAGRILQQPTDAMKLRHWPVFATWAFRQRAFEIAREKRHALADDAAATGKVQCQRCNALILPGNVPKHAKSRRCRDAAAGLRRSVFATPMHARRSGVPGPHSLAGSGGGDEESEGEGVDGVE